ncbi:uncharacterized protein LOC6033156 [Culex quinquefasciatus]|uniref:uncharacterized protein LOC6033156 n=1 Tax=Culex quinquefasciatus TaxID=7176 RepID=UPI0018E3FA13|nr:uncharacterized protein LOC6033156 [Culex quinquefasciatus]
MKLIAAFMILFAVACSAEYSKLWLHEVTREGKQCMQKLSISMADNVIERIMYNRGPTRDDMKYLRCFYIKFGILDANDKFVVDRAVEFEMDRYEEQEVRPVVTRCVKQDDPSVYERLWQFYQCFNADTSLKA